MRSRMLMFGICVAILCISVIWMAIPEEVNASKIVNLVQNNYKSITVNGKHIEAGTKNQYLIDDFIPKLSRYNIKVYNGELPSKSFYKVDINSKDGSVITLLDNDYLIINKIKYKISEGKIDLSKFYHFIDETDL